MKLSEMSQTELLDIAEEFGTDADESHNDKQIIARLMEDGITQEMVDTFLAGKAAAAEAEAVAAAALEDPGPAPVKRGRKVAVAKVEVPEQVLLYMDRENPTYQVRGYSFTREHPYALVDSLNAEYIVETQEGFRYATPKEAREYYS